MRGLVDLAKTANDERVRSVCLIALLDGAEVKPIDFDPASEAKEQPRFNPRLYTTEQLAQVKAGRAVLLGAKGSSRNKRAIWRVGIR